MLGQQKTSLASKTLMGYVCMYVCMYVYFDSIQVKQFYNNIDTIPGEFLVTTLHVTSLCILDSYF